MKIGIIGSGPVGQALAKAFTSEGHSVTLGTRNPSKPELVSWKKENPGVNIETFETTAGFADLIVLSVSGSAAEEAVKLAGVRNFANKTIIDTTNPIAKAPPVNGVLKFFTSSEESLMEKIQLLLPSAKLVKAFNSIGNQYMYKPSFPGGKPTMFICGNDEDAKKLVTGILTSFGWETEDMGMAESARAIEPLCILWCIPGLLQNRWNHAFKLLKA